MDELSHVFDENQTNSNTNTRTKRTSINNKKRKSSSMVSSDEGICLSTDSYDPLNDSIAQRIKVRSRRANDNSKQFDSQYFYNRVVDQIALKYKNSGNEDAIIDMENLEVIDKTGIMEKRIRTEFGYFAENTLEELRKTSFRDKNLIKSPIVDSNLDVIHSTPRSNKSAKSNKSNKRLVKCSVSENAKQTAGKNQTKRVSNSNRVLNHPLQPKTLSLPTNILSSNQLVAQQYDQSDDEEELGSESEELNGNHPLARYENRSLWTDKDYQIQCLRSAIEMLKNDESGLFRAALKKRAMETLNLPVLPSGSNLMPRIIFNLKGEPSFEFYFQSPESPLHVTEELPNMNPEILELTQIVYDLIRMNPTNRKNKKEIAYKNIHQIQYK